MNRKLRAHKIETDWKKISKRSVGEWKNDVKMAIGKANQERLLSQCFKDRVIEKTKTKYLLHRPTRT